MRVVTVLLTVALPALPQPLAPRFLPRAARSGVQANPEAAPRELTFFVSAVATRGGAMETAKRIGVTVR